MKKLLISTAIALVSTAGFMTPASAASETTVEARQTTMLQQAKMSLKASEGFYKGDFQSIANATANSPLYTGMGSAAMMSIRMARY